MSDKNLIPNNGYFIKKMQYLRNLFPIFHLTLLPGKFLSFDWLRAEVLNLKYLLVKITVTMVTQNHQIISSHELRKNGVKICRFKIRRLKNSKKICETKILRKVHRSGSMSGPAGSKTRTSRPICSPTKRNNSTKINTWLLAGRRNGIVYHTLFSK